MSFSGRCEFVLSCLFIRDESRSLRQYNDSEAGDEIVVLYFLLGDKHRAKHFLLGPAMPSILCSVLDIIF